MGYFLDKRNLLSHSCIVLSVMVVAMFIADRYNPAMGFINNNFTKWLLVVLAIFSAAHAVIAIMARRPQR